MMAFFHEQARQDPNIILLEESQLPRQLEGDYTDLTHANEAARERFSQYIAEVMEKLTRTNSPWTRSKESACPEDGDCGKLKGN